MSFRPPDDGTKMESPGTLVNTALDYAVNHVQTDLSRLK